VNKINFPRLLLTIAFTFLIALISFYWWMQKEYAVPILMYHSISSADKKPLMVIGHPSNMKLRLNVVSPESFGKQMEFLMDHGYQVISLDEYVQGRRDGKKFSHKTVVITFDDGYVDNYTNAFPILKKYHIPATIFLISDYVGKNPDLLNWSQVKEMDSNGISFGSHTRRHAYLPSQTEAQMKDEIVESKHAIEKELGKPVDFFAYPCGGFSEDAKAITALAGYKAAFTTNRGYDRYNLDSFELNRIHVNNWDNSLTLIGKLSGYYNFFRALKSSH
jgi:peptidoglycan/xylan/chitin deacetylase (PgdA/CDA1 family)